MTENEVNFRIFQAQLINSRPGTFNSSLGLISIKASVLYFLLIMTIHDDDYNSGINHNDYDDDNDDNDDQW